VISILAPSQFNKSPSQEPSRPFNDSFSDTVTDTPSLANNSPPTIKVLYRLHPELQKHIDFASLMPYLNRHEILTENERHTLNDEKSTPALKVALLLGYLEKKNSENVDDFVRALHEEGTHTGHKELCKLLQDNDIHIHMKS